MPEERLNVISTVILFAACILPTFYLLRTWLMLRKKYVFEKTTGQINRFSSSNIGPFLFRYRYKVEGKEYESSQMAIGHGALPFRSYLLDQNGRLRFSLGKEVPVFYDPLNPEFAVLVPSRTTFHWILWGATCFCCFLPLLMWAALKTTHLLPQPGNAHAIDAIVPFAALLLFLSVFCQLSKARRFPSLHSRVVESKVIDRRDRTDNKWADLPIVKVEYTVGKDTLRYCHHHSRWQGFRWQSAAEVIAAYPLGKEVILFYNPEAPWDVRFTKVPAWSRWVLVLILALIEYLFLFKGP